MMLATELRRQKALFALADGVALIVAFACALALHDPAGAMGARLRDTSPLGLAIWGVVLSALWLITFHAFDLYRLRKGGTGELRAIVKATAVGSMLTLLASFLAHADISRVTALMGYAFSVPAVVAGRALCRQLMRGLYANREIAIPLVVVGFNPIGRYLFDQILDELTPYEPVGFLDDGSEGCQYRGYPVIGKPDLLRMLASIHAGLESAIALPEASHRRQEQILKICEEQRVHWWMVPCMFGSLASGLRADTIGLIPVVGARGSNIEGLNCALKRLFDLTVSTLLLIAAAPVIGLAALAIRLLDGAPIFFRQERIGIHGRPFQMLKLRTMRSAAGDQLHRDYVRQWIREDQRAAAASEQPVFKLVNDQRITTVGRLLRRFSIDELPQLINVVRGEMSLIGPRPALPYELELYDARHRRRLEAAPGITGLWQVSGRNRVSFEDMVELDVQYLENWSFGTDLRILARTVPAMLRGGGW